MSFQEAIRSTLVGWLKQGLSSLGSHFSCMCLAFSLASSPLPRNALLPMPSQRLNSLPLLPSFHFQTAGKD